MNEQRQNRKKVKSGSVNDAVAQFPYRELYCCYLPKIGFEAVGIYMYLQYLLAFFDTRLFLHTILDYRYIQALKDSYPERDYSEIQKSLETLEKNNLVRFAKHKDIVDSLPNEAASNETFFGYNPENPALEIIEPKPIKQIRQEKTYCNECPNRSMCSAYKLYNH